MVQISASDRAELLPQVDTLRLRHAGGHRQTLQENTFNVSEWKRLLCVLIFPRVYNICFF